MLEQVPEFAKDETIEQAVNAGIEGAHDWSHISRVHEYMSRLSLDGRSGVRGENRIAALSGGWKKRVALARLLVGNHDLVLLDEPTNHLDVESILWLEEHLAKAPFAIITATHDRLFLQRISNRIWELDRRNPGGLLSIKGDYADYLEAKQSLASEQQQREITLKNTLRRETEWLRRGPKARSTKQYARIKQAGVLKEEVEDLEYRNTAWAAKLDFHSNERNPKKLIETKGIAKSFGDMTLFKDVNLLITPGLRLGLLGANGCGKTTLIKVLTGQEVPTSGTVIRSDQLQIAYFEQNRETLDPNATVADSVCPAGDHVKYLDNYIHIRSYLERFNFSQTQANMEVRRLSGGEQSRLLIARLMLKTANVLILDEPTNDLDMHTLEVLEQCLLEFPGAVILVTHDRYFLDQVANKLLAFGEQCGPNSGRILPFANLEQWERAYLHERAKASPTARTKEKNDRPAESSRRAAKRKLSFNEQFEFDHMEEKIHAAETRLEELRVESSHPDVISNAARLAEIMPEIAELEAKIESMFRRWAELERFLN
ncbi:MAG: ATP-binding cassette domain-containing protein [Deltaproteobacteria bacterium]|nr:ATP-binding cassette domain-containing protein [Deltaproteobacteria bacterium]